jgi:hypothetical protein
MGHRGGPRHAGQAQSGGTRDPHHPQLEGPAQLRDRPHPRHHRGHRPLPPPPSRRGRHRRPARQAHTAGPLAHVIDHWLREGRSAPEGPGPRGSPPGEVAHTTWSTAHGRARSDGGEIRGRPPSSRRIATGCRPRGSGSRGRADGYVRCPWTWSRLPSAGRVAGIERAWPQREDGQERDKTDQITKAVTMLSKFRIGQAMGPGHQLRASWLAI